MSQIPSPPAKSAATCKIASRSALSKGVRSKFKSSGRGIRNFSRRLRDATCTFLKRLWHGDEEEKKKAVLERGLKRAMFRCSVHLLAVSAITTLAYFNLAGYFIGSELQGLTGGVYQALDTLCLQVTAKLLVLVFTFLISTLLIFELVAGTAYRRFSGNNTHGHSASSTAIWTRRLAFGDLGLQATIHRIKIPHIAGIPVRSCGLHPTPQAITVRAIHSRIEPYIPLRRPFCRLVVDSDFTVRLAGGRSFFLACR